MFAADESAGLHGEKSIRISRIFNAPCARVWEAWTDPAQIVQWWGPHGFTTVIEGMDLRVGGQWLLTMRGPDGAEYPNRSTFTEVVHHERIAFTQGGCKKGDDVPGANFHAIWTFEDLGDNSTRLTVLMEFDTPEARQTVVDTYGAVEGGRQTLARLATLIEPGA